MSVVCLADQIKPEPKTVLSRITLFLLTGAFSLFSVVRFRNNECTTQESGMIGVCLKEEDCADQGGKKSGNCALGFGVCCLTM